MTRLSYPSPPVSDHVDEYHGTSVADPYRPLEDADAPATRAWIEAENELTGAFLASVPGRQMIRERLTQLWDHPRAGVPWRRGERWFQLRNTGLEDQDVLWTASGPDGEATVVLDPNLLGSHGTTALADVAASESGQFVACALSEAGSDWRTWIVVRAATGEVLPDRIEWSKFSRAAWTHDDAGFFYTRYPAPAADAVLDAANHDMVLCFHRLGTDPATDPVVLATPGEPDLVFDPEVSEDGRTLIVTVERGTDPETRILAGDLSDGPGALVLQPVLGEADAHHVHVTTLARTMYVLTDRDAPLGRLVALDLADPRRIREVVPEGSDALQAVTVAGGRLCALYLHHAQHRLELFELDGRPSGSVGLPGIGKVLELSGRHDDPHLYLSFVQFTAPAEVLAVAMDDGSVRHVGVRALAWNPADYVTSQVFVASDDGTQVPLFLGHRRDVVPNGDVPTLLYGYGGFQIAIGPEFKPDWLCWMERGGLLAVASLRGGAEYGSGWHDSGRLANKQNVFDDFAACARWLASSGWTRRSRIGISGRSNGGLLVGASITQHPELFGAAIAEVGVMDMLRFDQFTIGRAWTSDYGSPDDPAQFATLRSYSPLHNCRPDVDYPPTLVTTGDHDDRVVPAHSFKFAAALQACQAGDAPVLIRIDTDAGHGDGKPVAKRIAERADVLAFLEAALGRVRG